jgi:hypothetical protein
MGIHVGRARGCPGGGGGGCRVGRGRGPDAGVLNLRWHLEFSCFPRVTAYGNESRHPALRHRKTWGMLAGTAVARLDCGTNVPALSSKMGGLNFAVVVGQNFRLPTSPKFEF